MNQSLGAMVSSDQQRKFGADKSDTLPQMCVTCEVRFACHGECPKHRFLNTPDGEPGLNYLCGAYRPFFNHIAEPMTIMTALLRQGRPPAEVMHVLAHREQTERWKRSGPNDPCPCGSGKKRKKCHPSGR
jgi:uncharacterized protein